MAELLEAQANTTMTAVSIPTTTETVVISSGPVKVPTQTCLVRVWAWVQLTLGTGATAVTPRIRRGTTTSGTLVGGANAEAIKTAAGSTEPFVIEVIERRSNEDTVEYSLTVQQTGATANGSAVQAAIGVEVLSG